MTKRSKPESYIPFNKPFLCGKEVDYIRDAVESGKISGNGKYTKLCQKFFENRFKYGRTLLTSSCTDALEMCAILLNLQPGDEVICPSYTFVSTANAFVLHGAKIVFADSEIETPNIDADKIEALITPRSRAIVVVHYGGVACDMEPIMELAKKHNLIVIEDAAQAIDSYYKGRPLGSIGHLATFSFHETKNIISGEGGLLVINDQSFARRAEIIWEKGTNRASFMRGEVQKYNWVDIGSSFLPSEIVAAFLYAQLEQLDKIQKQRKRIWKNYKTALQPLEDSGALKLPFIPDYATVNGHLFFIQTMAKTGRDDAIEFLKKHNILGVFHYLPLHTSPFFKDSYHGSPLVQAIRHSETILRLPLYYDLTSSEQNQVIDTVLACFSEGALKVTAA